MTDAVDQADLRAIAQNEDEHWMARDLAMTLLANEPLGDEETREALYARLNALVACEYD